MICACAILIPWNIATAALPAANQAIIAMLLPLECGPANIVHMPCEPDDPPPPNPLLPPTPTPGDTSLSNPAIGAIIQGTDEDPLSMFSRRPLEPFFIPAGGLFMDPTRDEPHYGIDYTYPDDYLDKKPLWVHPIGPGYVTAHSLCIMCYVDGDSQGRVHWRRPEYNYGFGGLIVTETPYSSEVSIYVMYAHLSREFVCLGDYVTPDEVIGVAGTTGYTEQYHVHLEVRFGEPGQFWNADFSQPETMDRWLATMLANPSWLILPEEHASFAALLEKWTSLRPHPHELP